MSLHNGIDTTSWVSLGLYSKTFGADSYTIIDSVPRVTQACLNTLFISLGMLEVSSFQGGWHRWPTVMGWPWRKIWKSWG